jgi:hypothetical protein
MEHHRQANRGNRKIRKCAEGERADVANDDLIYVGQGEESHETNRYKYIRWDGMRDGQKLIDYVDERFSADRTRQKYIVKRGNWTNYKVDSSGDMIISSKQDFYKICHQFQAKSKQIPSSCFFENSKNYDVEDYFEIQHESTVPKKNKKKSLDASSPPEAKQSSSKEGNDAVGTCPITQVCEESTQEHVDKGQYIETAYQQDLDAESFISNILDKDFIGSTFENTGAFTFQESSNHSHQTKDANVMTSINETVQNSNIDISHTYSLLDANPDYIDFFQFGELEENQTSAQNTPNQKSFVYNMDLLNQTNERNGNQSDETNGNQSAETNGNQSAETNGNQSDETNGNQSDETNGNQSAETNGNQSDETNGNEPTETNGDEPAETNGNEPAEPFGYLKICQNMISKLEKCLEMIHQDNPMGGMGRNIFADSLNPKEKERHYMKEMQRVQNLGEIVRQKYDELEEDKKTLNRKRDILTMDMCQIRDERIRLEQDRRDFMKEKAMHQAQNKIPEFAQLKDKNIFVKIRNRLYAGHLVSKESLSDNTVITEENIEKVTLNLLHLVTKSFRTIRYSDEDCLYSIDYHQSIDFKSMYLFIQGHNYKTKKCERVDVTLDWVH